MSAQGLEPAAAAEKYWLKLAASAIITFFIGLGLGAAVVGITAKDAFRESDTAFYKALLWDIYDDYSLAMRDMEAAADLVKANYYAQHLEDPYRETWILEGLSPKFYANDAMEQMDRALKKLTKTEWPEEFQDEVSQLKIYIT